MTNLPCTCPTRTYTWTESATVTKKGSSSVVEKEAEDAAKALGEKFQGQMANSMNEWLKALRCAVDCEIGLIYVGPPSATYDERIAISGGPRFEILSYSETVIVVGRLSVDCHKPEPGKNGHEPGTGLRVLEEMMKERNVKASREAAKQPDGHASEKLEKGTIKIE